MRAVRREDFMEVTERLCHEQFGDEPLVSNRPGSEASQWESGPQPSPARSTTSTVMLTPVAQQAAARVGAASALLVKRCWFCEPDFGYHEETCSALEVFNNLEDALIEHDEAVLAAEEVGEDRVARRAARYYMYRRWVWEKHGYLGKGNRVVIPRCVVEFIRERYREPNCPCQSGGALYACTAHGYTGHREAPPPVDE